MRWERLFADLEAQAAQEEADALAAEVAERARAEAARVLLVDRLRALPGQPVTLGLASGPLAGQLREAGPDWLLLAVPGGEALVPLAAVLWVDGATRAVAPPAGAVERRLDLRSALRGVALDRAPVVLLLRDGSQHTGVLDRVAADHVLLAVTAPGEERRAGAVRGVRAVPLAALAVVRRA